MLRMIMMLVTVAWGLWIGALMALFIFVQTLFHNNRELAIQTAPQLFIAFQKYHLWLAMVALVATVVWRIIAPSRAVLVLFVLLAIAACCGAAVAIWIIGPMETLRQTGLSASPEFKRLHGRSMMLYLAQAVMLLASGIILPLAIRNGSARRSAENLPATNSPA